MKTNRCVGALTALLLGATSLPATAQAPLDSAFLAGFTWRSIGPANMAGRVTDVEGVPGTSTFYFAAASGGIWKTTNNGTTFRRMWDEPAVASMGDLAIAPSDSSIVWVGTGEEDSRNSIAPGRGVYRSTDGGTSWELMGLEETQAIGRIVIHPTNPDIVYVAALGATWNHNPERGLYKTTDGGRTWRNVKFISDRAGFVDLAMHPNDPNTLFASSWERVRGPYFLESGGPGSALWKSTDAGESWTEIRGGGFPEGRKGRIGVAIARSNPDVIYALLDADATTEGEPDETGLYRSTDGGETWTKMNDRNVRPFYYSQVRVDPSDPDIVYWSSTPVNFSKDGGETVGTTTIGLHVDHHALWIDPTNPSKMIAGNDGGIGITWDRGGNWEFVNAMPLGQFYEVSYSMEVPYRVCGGLQDNGSWCGPSRVADGEITNHHWATINGGDGFFTAQDPTDPNTVYAESQGGNVARIDMATGERISLRKPNWRDRVRMYEDSIIIAQPDTTASPTPEVAERIQRLRRAASRDSAENDLRFNWNTPFFISPHDPNTLYIGANRVLKSTDRGDSLVYVSPDLTVADPEKIRISTSETGGVTPDLTGAEQYATIVALAESPVRQGLLFAGTDDGNVWMSADDGGSWDELTGRFPGVPVGTYVRRIEPSHHDADRFYVAFDGHRTGDFTPYLFVTDDGGRSFRSIAGGLPSGGIDFVHVVREDPVNPDLLFVGTDIAAYVSVDRGASWQRFMNGMPAVPVHDLQIHPRDRELIAGTHGASIWIVDIAPLQQLRGRQALNAPVLFAPKPALQYGSRAVGGESTGQQWWETEAPTYGAELTYYIPPTAENRARGRRSDGNGRQERPQVTFAIFDPSGDTVQTVTGPATPGLNRAYWNLRLPSDKRELSPSEKRDSVLVIRRMRAVADSMIAAGSDAESVERAVTMLSSGDMSALRRAFGGGGGGGGFRERPGESYPTGNGEGRRGGGSGVSDAAREISSALRDYTRTLRSGYNPISRGWGGPPPRYAEPGTYTVHADLNGTTVRQNLLVERDRGFPANAPPPMEAWEAELFEEREG